MDPKSKIGIGVLIVVITGVGFILSRSDANIKTDTLNTTEKTYTMAEVAAHATEQSCWTAIRGNVYDLTWWIHLHPGGAQAILSLCGKDGTVAFTAQHNGQPNPEAKLITLLIGQLK